VRRVELGARTAYTDGLLTVDATALRMLVLCDRRIATPVDGPTLFDDDRR
jgi:hypothetical protein